LADSTVKKVPEGNYIIINGARTDYNSFLFRQGMKEVLDSYTKSGKIKIISEEWAEDWMPEEAFKCVEKALQEGYKIDAVIASNDNLAGAAIEALSEKRLAGEVVVVGQDADLAGCQRIVEGTQLMTVYKPIVPLAQKAAELAVEMAKGEEVTPNSLIDDGIYSVPSYIIQPIAVTKENMYSVVIQEGFHRLEDVYRNIPKSKWPKKE
jgi:D-xylose transport system substrate-binding protein